MTVYELMEVLKKCDPSAEVMYINENSVATSLKFDGVGYSDGCCMSNCEEVYLASPLSRRCEKKR